MRLPLAILVLLFAFPSWAAPAPGQLAQWQSRFEARTLRTGPGAVLPYRIAIPRTGKRHPLVIVLHGSGAIGSDNRGQLGPFAASWAQLLDDRADAPVVAVPQVASRSADYSLCAGAPCASRPGPSFGVLLQLLDRLAASKAVDRRRIHIVGFSMGGSAALQLALARPHLVAGVVAFSPVPPPLDRAAELKRLPLLVVHGNADTENPYRPSQAWMRKLHAVGGKANFLVRVEMVHQVPDDMIADPAWRRRMLRRGAE